MFLLADDEPVKTIGARLAEIGEGILGSVLFGLIGIGLMLLAFKLFDWLLPQVHFQRELSEQKNIAVAIVIAALLLGVAYIVGVVIR